jgi:ATP-binding cassette subfamily B protein
MNHGGPHSVAPTRRETAHLAIVCEPGSYAEQHGERVATDVERVFGRILASLKIPSETMLRPHRITVVARDANPRAASVTGDVTSDLTADVVNVGYGPSGAAEGLGEHLARIVLHRLTAALPVDDRQSEAQSGTSEAQQFFIEGAARFIAHRAAGGSGHAAPELLEARHTCVEAASQRKWRLPLYQAIVRGQGAVGDPAVFKAMQEGFSAYLVERDGLHEFLRFAAGARRDPNHSAEIIYGKTLELLEVEWIRSLRGDVFRRLMSMWQFIQRVRPWLRPYPWRQVECMALILIGAISAQVTPYQLRNLVDLLQAEPTKADPWGYGLERVAWILLVMVVAVLFNICSIVRLTYVVNVLGQNILRDMRVQYIDRINGLGAAYFGRMRTGDLMARFTSDMARLADPLARTVVYSAYYLILITVTIFGLIGLSWQLTLVLVVVVVPTYMVIWRVLGPMIQRVNRGRQERLAQINSHIEEMVIAHPVIQIFNLQDFLRRRTNPEIHEFRRVEIRSDFLTAVFREAADVADLVSGRLVLLFGSVLVLAAFDPKVSAIIGSISIGTVVGFSALMGRFVSPIHNMGVLFSLNAIAAAALRRVEEILDQPMEDLAMPADGSAEPPAVREGVTYEGVHFAYGLHPTLQDISLTIPAGTSAAFVGPTGAGKTTLVSMLPRFYDPEVGAVKIDGRDIRELALPALRSSLALVSQETALFNGTIRENIEMGKLGATDAEIVAAARSACIHDFVMSLPAGYDTIIGERGNRLSGGQRQRLAIARALLRNAPVLILDEATSALDAETEHTILEELAAVTAGKTVISITHRLALAMRSDVIYVLDEGRIVESGTHETLLSGHGLYRKLFEDQNEALLQSGLVPTGRMGGNGGNGATSTAATDGDHEVAAPAPA